MTLTDIMKEINNLGLPEKLLLVEDIWDSIALENAALPIPEWQKKELEDRYIAYKEGSLSLHDWQDVHNKLRAKYQ